MIGNDVICSFNPLRGEEDVYISNNTKCFVLSPVGLCEISKLYNSIAFIDGVSVGVFEDTSDNSFTLVTDALNFSVAGNKTVTNIEVIGTDSGTLTGALDYALTQAQTFVRTAFKNSNLQGIIHVKAGGYDFRVALTSTDFTTLEIDDIIVKVQYDDKRNIRGLISGDRIV
jgi:hypothetical protein